LKGSTKNNTQSNGKSYMPINNKRYYPADKKGVIDEWAAIVEHQLEDANIKKMKEDKEKADNQQNYSAELDYLSKLK
jgi:hypothetical protein